MCGLQILFFILYGKQSRDKLVPTEYIQVAFVTVVNRCIAVVKFYYVIILIRFSQ